MLSHWGLWILGGDTIQCITNRKHRIKNTKWLNCIFLDIYLGFTHGSQRPHKLEHIWLNPMTFHLYYQPPLSFPLSISRNFSFFVINFSSTRKGNVFAWIQMCQEHQQGSTRKMATHPIPVLEPSPLELLLPSGGKITISFRCYLELILRG